MTLVALAMMTPLLRQRSKNERHLSEVSLELKLLDDARSSGALDATEYLERRRALAESVLRIVESGSKRSSFSFFGTPVLAVLLPVAAVGIYSLLGAPLRMKKVTAAEAKAVAPFQQVSPIDHGADMQTAIAKLAEKLRQHPEDAEGWALLGRTYKAMQRYPQARDAFQHAVKAAPGDAELAREYAAAETPGEPQWARSPQ